MSIRRATLCGAALRSVLVAALLAGAWLSAQAADSFKVVGGYAIYLGVVPAELVQGHVPEHPERKMHGGPSARRGQHHIVIAVFDAATGTRVEDAVVYAKVGEPGLAVEGKRLEPMSIGGTVTFGGFFSMPASGPYRIDLRIDRPGAALPLNATFTYSHPR